MVLTTPASFGSQVLLSRFTPYMPTYWSLTRTGRLLMPSTRSGGRRNIFSSTLPVEGQNHRSKHGKWPFTSGRRASTPRSRNQHRSPIELGPSTTSKLQELSYGNTPTGYRVHLSGSAPVKGNRWQPNTQCAGTCTCPPIGQLTPVPFNPQYPSGFFARYCW
jgi:hypothetical protein